MPITMPYAVSNILRLVVSLLVCIDQHQICNQIKGLCNELDSYSRAVEVAQSHLELSPVQSELIKLLALDLPFETISGSKAGIPS